MSTRTTLQIAQEVARSLGAYEALTQTAAANTSQFTVASYPFQTALGNASTLDYLGAEARPNVGTEDGNARMITGYTPSTGVALISPAWATGMANTNTLDIFKKGVTYSLLTQAINRALRKMRFISLEPLSILADANCDSSAVTDWGTAVTSTASKVQTAGNVYRGLRALRVLNSSASGYLPTAAHRVRSSQPFYVQANVSAVVGTATLIAYDSTNSATITSETYAYRGWGRIAFPFTTPATCESLTLRLQGTGASDDIYWDDVMLFPTDIREITLPAIITEEDMVRQVYSGYEQVQEHDFDTYRPYYWWKVAHDLGNPLAQFKLQLHPTPIGPVYLEVEQPYPAVSAATDTIFADREWMELFAKVELLELLMNNAPGQQVKAWEREYVRSLRPLLALNQRHMPPPLVKMGFATPPSYPAPWT